MAVKKSGYSPEEIREHYKEATSFYGSEPQFEDGALPISLDRNKRLSDFDPNVGDSTLLGRNLLGRYIYPPGPGYQAHHIVPSREVAAEAVRELLRDAGIKINEWENGVWLPTRNDHGNLGAEYKHEFTFSQHGEYFEMLEKRLLRFPLLPPKEIRNELVFIGTCLQEGKLPPFFIG